MKSVITISLALCYLVLSSALFAQRSYTCTIQNQTVDGTDFSFDIYIQCTGDSIYLGQGEYSVTFNNGNFNSPGVSTSYELVLDRYDIAVEIPSQYDNIIKFTIGTLSFSQNQSLFMQRVCVPSWTAPGTKLATITVSNISIPSGYAGVQWRTISPHESKVYSYLPYDPWDLTNITANGTYTDPPDAPLPVELTLFTAEVNGDKVDLSWETKTEVSNSGFDIERSIKSGENEEPLWATIGFIEGNGNSNSPKQYSFTDKNPYGGSRFVYRLKQIDTDGAYDYSDEVEVELVPAIYELYQNYPNPFNPITNIKFSLPEAAKVSIVIYNLLGELVTEVVNQNFDPGYHKVEFNANKYASGVYIYRIVSKNFVDTKKMVLLK